VVDATLIAAPSSTKNATREREPEMKQSKKGNQWQFGHVKMRYRGLAKNTAQLHTLFALANLWMARRRLAGVGACVRPKWP
jgi:IS5 family transposase